MQSRAGENKQGRTGTLVTWGKSLVSQCLSFLIGNLRRTMPFMFIVRLTWNKIPSKASKGMYANVRAFITGFNPTCCELQALKRSVVAFRCHQELCNALLIAYGKWLSFCHSGPSAVKNHHRRGLNQLSHIWKDVRTGPRVYWGSACGFESKSDK